jgi:hypothetical protein
MSPHGITTVLADTADDTDGVQSCATTAYTQL